MIRILHGDCREVLRTLPDASVHCCITSPPYYGLRDYGVDGQIGLEATPAEYIDELVTVFAEVRRVLRDDGVLLLNLGESYANDTKWGGATSGKHVRAVHGATGIGRRRQNTELKSKDLIGIPWRAAFALQADGWYLRQGIVWHKPNAMPESVTDRCTTAHEFVFLLSQSATYWSDMKAIAEPCESGESDLRKMREQLLRIGGKHRDLIDPLSMASSNTNIGQKRIVGNGETRNKRSVWTIPTQPFNGAHYATMAPALAETCIRGWCPEGGTVLDCFGGAGTTGLVADRLGRNAILIDLDERNIPMAIDRISGDSPLFAQVEVG